MTKYKFKALLQEDGWHENMIVVTDQSGMITEITKSKSNGNAVEEIEGYVLPGFQNAHSHAFQYAMAGIAEHQNINQSDDFWGWREEMYKLALSVNPDQMEAIATMLYAEMLNHGYTNVAEFHYVHHDKNGKIYSNLTEMGGRLIAAAENVGINITLIPIFYQKGGFGLPFSERQKRFISPDVDAYLQLLERTEILCEQSDLTNIGMGVHSLRAVEPIEIKVLADSNIRKIPFHMHVSEQAKEVIDAFNYLGKRPVEWILENIALDKHFHLVHATHLSKAEVSDLALSQANVVLCPSTEGNLGDGFFSLKAFQELGGNWSIGTDSHIGLNPLEELRLLDYGQRLKSYFRHTFPTQEESDPAISALKSTTLTGRRAMGNFSERFFAVGDKFNACIIRSDTPLISTTSTAQLASTILYSNEAKVLATIVNGKIKSYNGQVENQKGFQYRFAKVIADLKNR